jgi:hypothetical protein
VKRSRRRKKFKFDPTLWVLTMLPVSVVCILLGVLTSWLRWLMLVCGGLDLFAGVGLFMYIAVFSDEHAALWIEDAPRTAIGTMVLILGGIQLFLYVWMARF